MRGFSLLLVIISIAVVGCQSTEFEQLHASPEQYFNDRVFPDYQRYAIETEEQVFQLSDDAKAFVDQVMVRTDDPVLRMESLVHGIFDYSQLDLLYMGDANTVASETYENRAANCLSMSIMTYAMARYAGFSARFQEIEIPEYWTRRDGFSLLNGHINLQIFPRPESMIIRLFNNGYQVDFDPQNTRDHFPKRTVSRYKVLAMFYNNKGADALVSEKYDKAYAYFRSALQLAPEFDPAWVNLGLLYRMQGQHNWAEQAYRKALVFDESNLTAWENLAYLYQLTARQSEADEIIARVHRLRVDNPYYHFILGEQEFEQGNWQLALNHYREALRLDKGKHEIYFGLAKVYYQLGDINRSQRYFSLAKRKSNSRQEQQKYQGKLDLLSNNRSY